MAVEEPEFYDRSTPFYGPLESMLRHPFLTVLPVLLLVGGAIALGLTRDPTYTAEARINVGRVDVPAYTLQGVTIGNATLAASYALAIEAEEVVEDSAREAGISPDEARDQLSASHVPRSTLIQIDAEGVSEDQAEDLANGAARALIDYVSDLYTDQQERGSLERYREAQLDASRLRRRLRSLQSQFPESARVVENARLDFLSALLRVQAQGARAVEGMAGGTAAPTAQNLLQLTVPASTAASDESSYLKRLGLIGLAAGLVLGIAIALLRANWQLLRRVRD